MSDAFSEFESADMSQPQIQNPKPEAPQIPTPKQEVTAPPVAEKIERPTDWKWLKNMALFILQLSFALLVLCLVLLLIWFGYRFVNEYKFPKAKPVVEKPVSQVFSSEDDVLITKNKRINKLEGQNHWLRKLLKDARREVNIQKENLATRQAIISNLQNEKTADEKYHEFLKYALDQFMSRPFAKGEGSRSICFTTDVRDRNCYQIVRPAGWNYGDPMPVMRRL